jgi:hypothetical protein
MTEDNIYKYVDDNGNFTHTKINGTKEQILELLNQYRETEFYKSKTDSQKLLIENILFPQIIETGMISQGILLELVMPSVTENFKFSDLKVGAEIKFDLPPRYKQDAN